MDAREMNDFAQHTFTAVIDKGTLDAVLCSYNPTASVESMLDEIYRVLVPGGIYICITNGSEEQRMNFFVYFS